MSLAAAKPGLERAINAAFKAMLTAAKNNAMGDTGAAQAQSNIDTLATALTNAIHSYVISADVNITMVITTVPPGQVVTTVGLPTAHVGATISPTIATHAQFGKLQ
tara:strand:- start:339 stop:656 length:318 start_codon:yes stop_codon:yes gene_type:complete